MEERERISIRTSKKVVTKNNRAPPKNQGGIMKSRRKWDNSMKNNGFIDHNVRFIESPFGIAHRKCSRYRGTV